MIQQDLKRNVVIGLALGIVALFFFSQARHSQPEFNADDIWVVDGKISEFTTIKVSESTVRSRERETLRPRSAFLLTDHPPNLHFYIPGSVWDLSGDIAVGSDVRLEVIENPTSVIARAHEYPDATYKLPIAGLQVGDHVYFRASESLQRAEQATTRNRLAGVVVLLLALAWLGWTVRSHRPALRALLDTVREW